MSEYSRENTVTCHQSNRLRSKVNEDYLLLCLFFLNLFFLLCVAIL